MSDHVDRLRWLGDFLDAEAASEGIGQGSEGARYCWAAATEIESLRQQLTLSNKCLRRVREACLYSDDDGSIGVTQEPHIDSQLFDDICKALAIQPDDTALQQFAAKVREQCEQAAQPEDSYQDDWFNAKTDAVARIRAIKELPK